MNDVAEAVQQEADAALTVLCVDDEVNILNSLRRLLRPYGYRVLAAGSGQEGLATMDATPVDLVICDMRMPEMDGARFLEEVRARWPDTVRILLTGYADINSTIAAINKGEIFRYIAKPWEDRDVARVVKDALERKVLERERNRLKQLTLRQNLELKELNAALDAKVRERTSELRKALGALNYANDKLKKSFLTSIKVFSNLIELREGAMAGHSRRVADLARRLAQKMKLPEAVIQDVTLAGLLHDIGKFGLSDELLRKRDSELSEEERAEVAKHPLKAQAALMALESLGEAAKLIGGHHERFDGTGYPERLIGPAIPLGARILAVANDYDTAQQGGLTATGLTPAQAREHIVAGRNKRYDPAVVDAFVDTVGATAETAATEERSVPVSALHEGMVLSRDLVTSDGIMLLSKDYVLDEIRIDQIRNYAKADGKEIRIYVHTPKRSAHV